MNTQTDLDYKEIIFGDIAKFVENMFYHCFSSILFRDLETVDKRMNSLSDDDLIQYNLNVLDFPRHSQISIFKEKCFGFWWNWNGYFSQKDDIDITVGEKSYNLARSFRTSTINELTVIDFEEMFDILWLMLGDNLIKSFEVNVCGILIESDGNGIPSTFRQENIDPLINKWWYDNVSTEIIPNLIKKLKENPLFNIRFSLT